MVDIPKENMHLVLFYSLCLWLKTQVKGDGEYDNKY